MFKKGNPYGTLHGYKKGHSDFVSATSRKKAGVKISLSKKGKPLTQLQREALKSYWESKKGKRLSTEESERLRLSHTGDKHWAWQGGITPVNMKIRHSNEYRLWREAVFKRDDFTCQGCKKRGVKLHADHIKPFAWFPELRFAIDNGRTLCVACHRKTDTYGGRAYKKFL